MSCPDRETLSAFFDGEAEDVREHVGGCAACQAVVREYGQIHEFLGSSGSSEFLGEPSHAEDPRNPRNPRNWWAVAVAVVVLIVVVAIALRRPPTHPGTFADYDGGGRAVIYVKGRS